MRKGRRKGERTAKRRDVIGTRYGVAAVVARGGAGMAGVRRRAAAVSHPSHAPCVTPTPLSNIGDYTRDFAASVNGRDGRSAGQGDHRRRRTHLDGHAKHRRRIVLVSVCRCMTLTTAEGHTTLCPHALPQPPRSTRRAPFGKLTAWKLFDSCADRGSGRDGQGEAKEGGCLDPLEKIRCYPENYIHTHTQHAPTTCEDLGRCAEVWAAAG